MDGKDKVFQGKLCELEEAHMFCILNKSGKGVISSANISLYSPRKIQNVS